jgi:cardiolipin synthase A/B
MWMAVKRGIVVAIGLLIQILLTLFIYLKFGEFISIIQVVYGLLSIIIVLMIIKYSKRLSCDLIWILLIMLFPLIGTLLYIILSNNMKRSKVLKNINSTRKSSMSINYHHFSMISIIHNNTCKWR